VVCRNGKCGCPPNTPQFCLNPIGCHQCCVDSHCSAGQTCRGGNCL
jgi:hypothetical protein